MNSKLLSSRRYSLFLVIIWSIISLLSTEPFHVSWVLSQVKLIDLHAFEQLDDEIRNLDPHAFLLPIT